MSPKIGYCLAAMIAYAILFRVRFTWSAFLKPGGRLRVLSEKCVDLRRGTVWSGARL